MGNFPELRTVDASAAALFSSPESFGTSLLLKTVDLLGPGFLSSDDGQPWSQASLALEIKDRTGVQPTAENLARLFAAIDLCTSGDFYASPEVFVSVAARLNGEADWTIPDVTDTAWAIIEAAIICPSPYETKSFSDDIQTYLVSLLKHEGFQKPPQGIKDVIVGFELGDPHSWATGDPDFYAAVVSTVDEAVQAVNAEVIDRLRRLLLELKSLKLADDSWNRRLQQYVKSVQETIT